VEELIPAPPNLDLRHRLFAFGRRLFAAPYLPNALIFLALLIILSDNTFVIIQQPTTYWADYANASASFGWLEQLLIVSPWLFAAVILVYLVVIGLVLYLLTRPLALVLWIVVCFLHLRSLIGLSRCGLNGIYRISDPNACNVFDLVLVIVIVGLLGFVFAHTLLVTGQAATKPKRLRFLHLPALLTLGWLLFLGEGVFLNATVPSTGWILVQSENRPLGRIHGVIAYDTLRQTAVLFGGASAWLGNDWLYINDTWEWDGTDWQQRQSQTAPPGRVEHSLAFDESRKVIVLFGGRNQNGPLQDTWEWDGQEWQARFPVNSPSPRCCLKAFFDSRRGKVVLYGGYDERTFFNDAWEWDGENWQAISLEPPGPALSGAPIAYDTDLNRAVAFQHGNTWLWQERSWSTLSLDLVPPSRGTTNMAYDPGQKHMVLFGGEMGAEDLFNDTWLFDGESWQELEPPRLPAARWGHAMFYDAVRQRILIFGGFDGVNYNNDLWELSIAE
jgi:hypothetical protein